MLSRAPAARVVEARDGLREFVVVVETRGAAFACSLTILDGTSSTSREFVGPTCGVVTSALALVAALAIDPRAQQSLPESRKEGAESDVPASEVPDLRAVDGAGAFGPRSQHPDCGVLLTVPQRVAEMPTSWRWSMGVTGEAGASTASAVAGAPALSSSESEGRVGGPEPAGLGLWGVCERSLCRDGNHHEECGCGAFSVGDGAARGMLLSVSVHAASCPQGCGAARVLARTGRCRCAF